MASPYDIGAQVGKGISGAFSAYRQDNAMDKLLQQASQSDDPNQVQNIMGMLVSQVSPERRQDAMQLLTARMGDLKGQQQRQRQQASADKYGYDADAPDAVNKELVKNRLQRERYNELYGDQEGGAGIEGGPSQGQGGQGLLNMPVEKLIQRAGDPDPMVSGPAKQALIQLRKQNEELFEKEADKLEAKRVSELATQIEKDYGAAVGEEARLNRMEQLDKKGELSTPLMVKSLNALGLPLGILSNPDTEEHSKLETDFIREVRDIFPGGRITNYEVQTYLRTIPTLMNTPEGRTAIRKNMRIRNEAKKIRYDEYKNILKENKGRKPPNMGILIQERTQDRINQLEDQYADNIQKTIDKHQAKIRMKAPNGRSIDVPPSQIEEAMRNGAQF